MLKKRFLVCSLAVIGFLHLGSASAITLSVEPTYSVINVGDTFTADLVISGLIDSAPPSLGRFDIDLNYDASIFSVAAVNPVSFGDQLDFGFNGVGDSVQTENTAIPGVVNLFELSFEIPFELDLFQPGEFTLASVSFVADSFGSGTFSLAPSLLTDSLGNPLFAQQLNPATVEVIPVPAAVWLFATGVLGLVGLGKRRRATQG